MFDKLFEEVSEQTFGVVTEEDREKIRKLPIVYRGGRHVIHCDGEKHWLEHLYAGYGWKAGELEYEGLCWCKEGKTSNESVKINEQLGEEDFQSKVDVHVHMKDLEAGEDTKVVGKEQPLNYRMDVEYRSWGINGIDVRPARIVEFEVEILDVNDKVVKTLPVKIDFDTVDCDIEWLEGKVYVPSDLEVHLTRDGKIEEVTVTFYYVKQD